MTAFVSFIKINERLEFFFSALNELKIAKNSAMLYLMLKQFWMASLVFSKLAIQK